MSTSPSEITEQVQIAAVRLVENALYVGLSDGRELGVSLDGIAWPDWLQKATEKQRAQWSIEPGGFAVYWDDLDDGIELTHLLSMQLLI